MPLSFAQPTYLLEKTYGNLLRILDSYRKEVRTGDKSEMGHSEFTSHLLYDGFKTPWQPDREVEYRVVKNQKTSQKRVRSKKLHNVY